MLPVIISNVAHICTNMFSKNHLCGSLINDGISEIGYFGWESIFPSFIHSNFSALIGWLSNTRYLFKSKLCLKLTTCSSDLPCSSYVLQSFGFQPKLTASSWEYPPFESTLLPTNKVHSTLDILILLNSLGSNNLCFNRFVAGINKIRIRKKEHLYISSFFLMLFFSVLVKQEFEE